MAEKKFIIERPNYLNASVDMYALLTNVKKILKKLCLLDALKGVLSVKISCVINSTIQRDGIKMLMDI